MIGILLLVSVLALPGSVAEPWSDPARPRVVVAIESGPYYVGQGINLTVTAPSGEIAVPALADAEVIAVQPRNGSESRFVLIPRRAGALTVGPFQVKVDDRQIGSKPATIRVANVPSIDRPPMFLGGVGGLDVASSIEPVEVRVGATVEFRLTLTGPAAWGITAGPPLAKLPAGLRLRSARVELEATDPPVRTVRYRLRAIESGRLVVPPVAVAAFDPVSRRFLTRSASSRVLTVASIPAFDPTAIEFGPASPAPRSGRIEWVGAGLIGLAVLFGIARTRRSIQRRFAWWRARRPVNWAREGADLNDWFRAAERGAETVAAEVTRRLTRAIERSVGLHLAALTPDEARLAVTKLVHHNAIGERVHALVTACDQIRFDSHTDATAGDLAELIAEAVAVFRDIGESAPPRHQQHHAGVNTRPDRQRRA